MERQGSRQIIVAGGGIAGLTAALAFAGRGFAVQLYERAARLEEAGAGLQLSPNAVHLLRELGVTQALASVAVRPDAVKLVDAVSLKVLAEVRLGEFAERRWGAPYLVAHRADLQSMLLARARQEPDITIATEAAVSDFALHARGVTASIDRGGRIVEANGRLLVAADGVWSTLRALAGESGNSRFSGNIAWRATVRAGGEAGALLARIFGSNAVGVLVHSACHIIVYPLRSGELFNLVAVIRGDSPGDVWTGQAAVDLLRRAVQGCAAEVRALVETVAGWTVWPINTVAFAGPWALGGAFALIGDAAHAMTPFAAQGAAMAIEDAITLADTVAASPGIDGKALDGWEAARRQRIARVLRRGALNRFAWHASGPVALARNLFLRTRSGEKLATDLDWLYGWRKP
jgi:salicylate hydroxylase